MDVSFVVAAARRYWWIVALCTALGVAPFLALKAGSSAEYESTARLLVTPPSDAPSGVSFSPDPDRYIVGQLGILRSESIASQVAAKLKPRSTTKAIQDGVAVTSQPGSDVVSVTVRDENPQRAREIADAYVGEYFTSLRRQISETQKPELDNIDKQISALTTELARVDEKIGAKIAPYLPGGGLAGSDRSAIPTAEQVAPDLNSQKLNLLTQYNEIVATRTRQEIGSRLRVTSQVVERASLPTIPAPGAGALVVPAGLMAGAFAGVVLAGLIAHTSPKVLDRRRAEDALGIPIIGKVPSSSSLTMDPKLAVDKLPEDLTRFVDLLRVRADGYTTSGHQTRILVAASGSGADTAGLAAAIAGRYAAEGTATVLIDQNSRQQTLTRHNSNAMAPVAGTTNRSAKKQEPNDSKSGAASTSLRFVPFAADSTSAQGTNGSANSVVVIDGGSLLSSHTARASQTSDVVVLAIALRKQRKSELRDSAAVLQSRGKDFLPVLAPDARE